jgi:predicted glycogen debranching enzyme
MAQNLPVLAQSPSVGDCVCRVVGDLIVVCLKLDRPCAGRAFLRSDLGNAAANYQEIVDEVERGTLPRNLAWNDRQMTQVDQTSYEIAFPLEESGRFEAKAWFLPDGNAVPVWPVGDWNMVIHVIPASPLSVYQAFVRLFGEGTFEDLSRCLPTVLDEMGFRVLLLLPIFPVGHSKRSDRAYASPFASLDYFAVDPTLGSEFDALVNEVHGRGAKLWLDLPINHTGWNSRLQTEHPEWFCKDAAGDFVSPGAWGVVWEDLVKLDFGQRALWAYLADVFLYWCGRGVDGFRCDAGHMIPAEVWRYLVAKVRLCCPDTVFLLEGLGGGWENNAKILDKSGIGFVYSELFQKYEPAELREHLRWCARLNRTISRPVHFAETHDNDRLASVSQRYAKMRVGLAALTSCDGAWGIACGAEWFSDGKMNVYERTSLSWGEEPNQVAWIAKLNTLVHQHPCFAHDAVTEIMDLGNEQVIAMKRVSREGDILWGIVNIDVLQSQAATLSARVRAYDLLSEREVSTPGGNVRLAPGQVVCVSLQPNLPCTVRRRYDREVVVENKLYAVLTNGRGAMAQVRGDWGSVRSQYDCLLGANLHPSYPVDRRILFTRCRAWVRTQKDSCELGLDSLTSFVVLGKSAARWEFQVGEEIQLSVTLRFLAERNAVQLDWERIDQELTETTLIVRPDIEDRNFHDRTYAWDAEAEINGDGFVFAPTAGYRLELCSSAGQFESEPEWSLAVPHRLDAERGLGKESDLFSPGYFEFPFTSGQIVQLGAYALLDGEERPGYLEECEDLELDLSVEDAALQSMDGFLVSRKGLPTVIAGYPWFLDWGRDTLISLRGLISAGRTEEAKQILVNFARLEDRGTLPNMLRGGDDSDRETSDAPLWFGVACADVIAREGNDDILLLDCDGRNLGDVLKSIAAHYRDGAANSVGMNAASGLIYSPSHFTWMDTDGPPCTPREGYPIEIQALWWANLRLLATVDPGGAWDALSAKVRASVIDLYQTSEGGLADCLEEDLETQDDSVRPNQLLAVTLGMIDEPTLVRRIVSACQCLLVPGAIRSLAPSDPKYRGHYTGPEDGHRKPAYHNGTAWTWLFPSYVEALILLGDEANGRALLGGLADLFEEGCVGHLPEILDGDAPHEQRGCGAQAWSASEFYRVWALLQ